MPTLFCEVQNLGEKKRTCVQSAQEDSGGDESSQHGNQWSANLAHVPHEVQLLQQVLPQRAHPQVSHDEHPQGGEKQGGLELQVLWASDPAEQNEVDDDPETHEERPPHRLRQQLRHPDHPA